MSAFVLQSEPFPITALRDALFWGPIGLFIGVRLFFRGFSALRRRELVRNTPTSAVRSAAIGPVEVSGKAVGPYTLVAPLSKRDCLYYRLAVSGSPQHIVEEECAPLFLDDHTGLLMIAPQGANLELPVASQEVSGTSSEYLRHVLSRHGLSSDTRVDEFCICLDDDLYILGTLSENPWAAEAPGGAFHRFGPGFISEAEADLQRRTAFGVLDPNFPSGATQVSAGEFDLHPPVILMKGSSPFVITEKSERDVLAELNWQTRAYIWGGPLLALFCLWNLLLRIGLYR